jgi:hypothetical protein
VIGGVALILPYLGLSATAFGFVPLSGPIMGAMILMIIAYIAATEAAKRWFFRTASAHPTSVSGPSREHPVE